MNLKSFLYKKLKRETSSGNYIPEIDGLRFIAISTVILYHIQLFYLAKSPFVYNSYGTAWIYTIFDKGFRGVEIFFVISGFILALPFASYFLKGTKKPNLKKYYYRRLTRLEPPYILALVLFFMLHILKGRYPIQDLVHGLFLNTFYLQNFAWLHFQPMIGNITWSLEIEVQFYLLAPLLAHIFLLTTMIRRTILVGAITGLPLINAIFVPQHISLYGFLFYFLIGFLIADIYLLEKKDVISTKVAVLLGGVAFVTLYLINLQGPVWNTLIFAWALFLFIYLVLTTEWWRKIFGIKLFTTIGGMCYSLYLLHTVIISGFGNTTVFWRISENYAVNILFQVGLLLGPILLLSTVYFAFVEKPCMNKNWPIELRTRIGVLYKQIIRI